MSSDLIRRLRDEPRSRERLNGLSSAATVAWHETCLEAADTIESLTAERDALKDQVEKLEDPGWNAFIEICQTWLKKYPPNIFTGVSGDSGPLFVVALRKALSDLAEPPEQQE